MIQFIAKFTKDKRNNDSIFFMVDGLVIAKRAFKVGKTNYGDFVITHPETKRRVVVDYNIKYNREKNIYSLELFPQEDLPLKSTKYFAKVPYPSLKLL